MPFFPPLFIIIKINVKSKVVSLLGNSKEKLSLFLEPRKIFQCASHFLAGIESVTVLSLLDYMLVELFEAYNFLHRDSWKYSD